MPRVGYATLDRLSWAGPAVTGRCALRPSLQGAPTVGSPVVRARTTHSAGHAEEATHGRSPRGGDGLGDFLPGAERSLRGWPGDMLMHTLREGGVRQRPHEGCGGWGVSGDGDRTRQLHGNGACPSHGKSRKGSVHIHFWVRIHNFLKKRNLPCSC